MSNNAPINIESYIRPTVLAELCGFNIHEDFVPWTSCPFCQKNIMRMFEDVETGGNRWYCASCKKSYTSLQLYQEIRSLPNFQVAWTSFCNEAKLDPYMDSNVTLKKEYENYLYRQNEIHRVIRNTRLHLVKDMPVDSIKILENNGLWDTNHNSYLQNHYYSHVGSFTYSTFNYLLKFLPLPKMKFLVRLKDCLVVPFEDSPGHISGLWLWDTNGQTHGISTMLYGHDHGILGLSQVQDEEEAVVAILDPKVYLKLHHQWTYDNNDVLNCVCIANTKRAKFTKDAQRSINNIPSKKVVFWDFGHSATIMNMARSLRDRGYIAMAPFLHDDGESDPLAVAQPYRLMKMWIHSSKHWTEALKQWVFDLPSIAAKALVDQLMPPISQNELEQIQKICTDKEFYEFRSKISLSPVMQIEKFGPFTLMNREEHGIYKLNDKNDTESRISEAVPIIEEISIIDSETWMAGQIHFKQHKIPFTVREDEFSADPAKFIIQTCLKQVNDYPHISTKYRSHMMDIGLLFSQPRKTASVDKVGWNTFEGQWVFPGYTIKKGRFSPHSVSVSNIGKLPFHSLSCQSIPNLTEIQSCLDNKLSNALGWALLTTISSNLVAAERKEPNSGIALVRCSEITDSVLYSIGESLSLSQFNGMSVKEAEHLEKLVSAERKHDAPVILQHAKLGDALWRDWMAFLGPRNVIVKATNRDAANLALTDNWIMINNKSTTDKDEFVDMSPACKLLPHYLRWLQERSYVLPRRKACTALRVHRSWIEYLNHLGVNTNGTAIEEAEKRISDIPSSPWVRFFWGLFYLLGEGDLTIETNTNSALRRHSDTITINWNRTASKLEKKELIIPDADMLEHAISEEDEVKLVNVGWRVPVETWETLFRQWERIFLK